MATSFLLKSNIYLNPLTNHYSIIQFSPIQSFTRSPNLPRLFTNPRLTLKCYVASQNLNKPVLNLVKREIKRNPYELFVDAILKALKPIQEATVALVFFMAMAFMSFSPNSAFAAGGGRMGGRSFPSKNTSTPTRSSPTRSSPSTSSPSRSSPSRSSPSRSSSSTSSPSRSSPTRSSPTRSYPSTSSSYSSPSPSYSSPSPSYSSPSPSYSSPSPSYDYQSLFSSPSYSSPTVLVESVSVDTAKPPLVTHQKNNFWSPTEVIVATLSSLFILMSIVKKSGDPPSQTSIQTSVLKLQVGLLGSAKSLQKELDRIAENADTSKKAGLTYILTETTRAVLQHSDYCISGYSSVGVKSNIEDGEKMFNEVSIEERGKIDEETLVNVDNKKKQSTSRKSSTGINNEYIVITIVVAAEGVLKLPTISSNEDLKESLKLIGSITTDKTLAVEVLWTPQDENEILTELEVLEKYPLLRSLSDTI